MRFGNVVDIPYHMHSKPADLWKNLAGFFVGPEKEKGNMVINPFLERVSGTPNSLALRRKSDYLDSSVFSTTNNNF